MTDPLQAAHNELDARLHAADETGDWHERAILSPLVDVADYLRRLTLARATPHYRADKAGPLVRAAHRAQLEAFQAYAGWPDDDAPTERDLHDAAEVLDDVCTAVRGAMWATARGEDITHSQARKLSDAARRLTKWAEHRSAAAVPDINYDE